MTKAKKGSEVRQVGRFGLVGIANTVLDFVVYNLLLRFLLNPDQIYAHLGVSTHSVAISGVVLAGIISGTIAMINSFIFNQRYTFRTRHTSGAKIAAFFVITAFGVYVIRPLITSFLTKSWLWPSRTVYTITHALHLPLTARFDTNNLALAVSIFIVLFYNYVMYKKFIFNDGHKKS